MDDDEHHIDHKDSVTVDNGHYIVAASGKLVKIFIYCVLIIFINLFIKFLMKNLRFLYEKDCFYHSIII